MKQDVNRIIDELSAGWANDVIQLRKQLSIVVEENHRLKSKVDELSQELKEHDERDEDD